MKRILDTSKIKFHNIYSEQRGKKYGGIKMSGLFGDMFDFDHDGEMDSFEKAAEFNFLEDLLDDERNERKAEYNDCFDDEDEDDDDDEVEY